MAKGGFPCREAAGGHTRKPERRRKRRKYLIRYVLITVLPLCGVLYIYLLVK
jgi:hypothetical protein